jgi:molecular chaperone HscB
VAVVQDHFALFDLPRRYEVDPVSLERRFRDVQSKVHPDKHAHLGDAQKRLAMQWATQANEAFQTLKNPLKRAQYLFRLAGHDAQIENNTAMPPAFLMEQMELREEVGDARAARADATLDGLRGRLKTAMATQYATLGALIDDKNDYAAAAGLVRQLMFQEKLLQEIDDAIEAIEA